MTSPDTPAPATPDERLPQPDVQRQFKRITQSGLLVEIVEAIPQSFLILNRQRQIIFANTRFVTWVSRDSVDALLGLRYGEAIGCRNAKTRPGGCGTSPACRLCGALRAVGSALAGQPDVQEYRIVTEPAVQSHDLRVWTRTLALPDLECVLLILEDITNEKRRTALERIFFHDLLNVAVGLREYSSLLEVEAEVKETVRFMTDKLIEEIAAQRDLAAAERHELALRWAPADSLALARDLVQLYHHHPATRNRALVLAPDAVAVRFPTDLVQLRRVLGNMIKNALEAAKAGETVTLGCGPVGGQVEFRVHNPSVMPPEVQAQMFQRSFSTKGPGRGLGTYSMKLLTEQYLRGAVSFLSAPGQGTTFFARYPLTT